MMTSALCKTDTLIRTKSSQLGAPESQLVRNYSDCNYYSNCHSHYCGREGEEA